MTVACDFCGDRADRHDDRIFIAAASTLAHICEECVACCAAVIETKKAAE